MNRTDSKERIQKSLEVARLYYEVGLDQVEIAKKLGISRPTISRLLQFALQEGIVQIKIVDPFFKIEELEKKIAKKYDLKQVKIVYSDEQNITEKLGERAASYLETIVKDGDIIGISWGKTMYATSKYLKLNNARNVKIVELKGSIIYTKIPIYVEEVLRKFGQAFNTNPSVLPLPVVFESKQTRDIVLSDRFVKNLIDLGKKANIALFTVGTVKSDALLFQTGYFNQNEILKIQTKACGDICSRFYDDEGNIAVDEIDERTVGIQLDELKSKEYSILIAGGKRKYQAIKGALAGKYPNCLITDIETAKNLLDE